MPTTITPSAGVSPSLLQLGPGATTGYGAIDWRRMVGGCPIQEGVISSGSYKVTAGAGMTVSIAGNSGLGAMVQGDSITAQGIYYVPPHSAAISETVTAAHASLPRIDQVVLEILDASHDGGGSNIARTRIVNGTATSGATLDNRTGAAALPVSTVRLCDLLVPAASVSVSAGNIRDRRPWARGARHHIVRNTNAAAGSDFGLGTGGAWPGAAIDATVLAHRVECSGSPMVARLQARIIGASSGHIKLFAMVDGIGVNGQNGDASTHLVTAASSEHSVDLENTFTPSAGSHIIAWGHQSGGATGHTMYCRATLPVVSRIEELDASTDNT